jgi:hypothetical protein
MPFCHSRLIISCTLMTVRLCMTRDYACKDKHISKRTDAVFLIICLLFISYHMQKCFSFLYIILQVLKLFCNCHVLHDWRLVDMEYRNDIQYKYYIAGSISGQYSLRLAHTNFIDLCLYTLVRHRQAFVKLIVNYVISW